MSVLLFPQVLLEDILDPADLGKEAFVTAVLQSFTAADSKDARAAAALLLAKMTPGVKHLANLLVCCTSLFSLWVGSEPSKPTSKLPRLWYVQCLLLHRSTLTSRELPAHMGKMSSQLSRSLSRPPRSLNRVRFLLRLASVQPSVLAKKQRWRVAASGLRKRPHEYMQAACTENGDTLCLHAAAATGAGGALMRTARCRAAHALQQALLKELGHYT